MRNTQPERLFKVQFPCLGGVGGANRQKNKKYFFDIKTRLDEEIKDKEGALRFLDGIQKTFGIFLREGNSRFSEACLINCIDGVEKARGDIRQNVGYKYVIRNLILSLEEA